MAEIKDFATIEGVQLVKFVPWADTRGVFTETFRKEWFPQRDWERVQMNVSRSSKGCVRGMHYHHHQVDFWIFIQGEFRVGLYDLRPSSSTSGKSATIDLSHEDHTGVYIPQGVAHGFSARSDVIMSYLVDNYYDNTDELSLAWDDPDIGIDWGVEVPKTSERDTTSPRLKDIPKDQLPK